MAVIINVQALHAAVAAVCPIDGVSGDGTFWAQASATPAQLAAAHNAITSFVDSPTASMMAPKPTTTPLPTAKAITDA